MASNQKTNQATDPEAELLRRMLNTPPQPHKKPKAKKLKANKKKPA